jgi:hypothetical protein
MLLKNLEKKMWDFEGFQVRVVKIKGGRDVRADKRDVGNYNSKRKAKGTFTVKEFVGGRLRKRFEKFGWRGQVVLGDGSTAHGNMTLENVRKSYSH